MTRSNLLFASCLFALLVSGTRAADNTPPEGFTALFNGRDLSGWKGLVADPPKRAKMTAEQLADAQKNADEQARAHWKVADGVIVFDGKGSNLCTAKDYGNFELYVDWKILPAGDSGIYLRGSPQVQIWDAGARTEGSGGLYNNQKNPSKPTACADKPVGEWNTFRIKMVGEVNQTYMESLTDVFPANRKGPLGDVLKTNCATCHQGVNKPLYGFSMAKEYPELSVPNP